MLRARVCLEPTCAIRTELSWLGLGLRKPASMMYVETVLISRKPGVRGVNSARATISCQIGCASLDCGTFLTVPDCKTLCLSARAQPLHDPQDKEHAGSELAPRLAPSHHVVQRVAKYLRSGRSDAR